MRGDLVMRRWRRSDVPALSAAVAESIDHLRPWMPWAAAEPLAPADREALIARWERSWETGDEFNYGLFVGGRVAGSAGLMRRIGPGGLEIGYWVHVAHVRRGLATTASTALTDVAFTQPEVTHVEIHHDLANVASGRVPARLGFRLVGDEPDEPTAPSEVGVARIWRMERAAWPRHRPPTPPDRSDGPGREVRAWGGG
ncbi:MAG TPA: GNAT family N-acetyltransferase [Acidimicrobiales bacterium]|nr:GNAT family N-acetyltransferase [Acidimicrobiales bacterium]